MSINILIVGGWSFAPDELTPLLSALPEDANPTVVPIPDLAPPSFQKPASLDKRFTCRVYEKHYDLAIGWSQGAMMILEASLNRNLIANRLLLLAGCARFTEAVDFKEGVSPEQLNQMSMALHQNRSRCIRDFRRACAFPNRVRQDTSDWDPSSLDEGLDYLARYDVREILPSLQADLLMVHGDKDSIISPACSDYIHQQVPTARLIRVPNAGHDLCLRTQYPLSDWIQQALHPPLPGPASS